MTYYRNILAATLFLGLSLTAMAQIDLSWDKRDSIVTNIEEGAITDSDYAASGIIEDWSTLFKEYQAYDGDKQLDSIDDSNPVFNKTVKTLKGLTLNLPYIPDENGTDLYMLTTEGIEIYLALDEPAYHQAPDEDIIKWIRYYAFDKKAYTQKLFNRYKRWESRLKDLFRAYGVPEELTELCLIESGCTYNALSHAGAKGMWQIMPETGRQFGLTINDYVDQREDPVLSTQTAIKILTSNYRRVGDWTLAAAAYNCGAGRILGHIKKGNNSWERMKPYLPKETRQYIPSLIAIHYVWTYKEQLGF